MSISIPCKWHELKEEQVRDVVAELCHEITNASNLSIETLMNKARELGVKVVQGYDKKNVRCVMFTR